MMQEKVSVIVPIYNVQEHLTQCLNSIVSQTHNNLDIILIDDGSTDCSGQICDDFAAKDTRINVIHCKNQGVAVARNQGVAAVTGSYMMFVDSDDYIAPYIVERLLDHLKACNADIAMADYIQGEQKQYRFEKDEPNQNVQILDNKACLDMLYESHHASFIIAAQWGKLYKKELFDGIQYPDGKIFEDIAVSHHLFYKAKRVTYTNAAMYYYYQHPTSILGKQFHLNKLDYLEFYEDRIAFFDRLGLQPLKEKAQDEYMHALMWEYSRVSGILKNKLKSKEIFRLYRKQYHFGMKNLRYQHENRFVMAAFYVHPKIVDLYWVLKNKLNKMGGDENGTVG